jgi:hypothetical protein
VIKACNEVLLVLDSLEENRQLFKQEANFKSILKNHIMLLLQRKKYFFGNNVILSGGLNLVMKAHVSSMLQPQNDTELTLSQVLRMKQES